MRFLTDLFLNSIKWDHITNELNTIKILEVGCGRGIYGDLINQILNKKLLYYIGIDPAVKKEWEKFESKFKFFVDRSENSISYFKDINLLLTVTALEHFEKDLKFFNDISDHLSKETKPFLQIHIIPAYSCLKTYLGHGLRQYSPKLISKITRLFDGKTKKTLIGLGGSKYNDLTFKYITIPRIFKTLDKRKKNFENYKKELTYLLNEDNIRNNDRHTAYALILETNFKENIKF